MVNYSIIQKSQLEGGLRLDAEYYQPEYLSLNSKLKNQKSKFLADLAKNIICGPFGSAILQEDYRAAGVPLIRVSDLNDWFVRDDDLVFIKESLSEKMKRYQVTDGDIVVSQRGTIAMFSRVTNIFPKWNISANLISIKKSPQIDFDYLLAFLNSFYGINQLYHKLSGQVQPKITTDDVRQILIFVPDIEKQREIAKFIQNSRHGQESSKSLYSQAENLLLTELGLSESKAWEDETLSYIVNLSEAKSAHRADAEYFQPKYEKLVERIKKHGADPLLSLAQNVAARFNPKSQPTKLFQYVELSNITSSVGTIDGFSEVSGDEAPSRAKRVLKTNDVILSSVEGSLEKVALAGKEQEGYLASNGFFQFRSKDILPEVLLVLAKSFILQMQFGKETAGTILTAVPKEAVKNIVVPKVDKPTQQKIADLVQKSHEARSKAKQLLEEAKNKVANLIEVKS